MPVQHYTWDNNEYQGVLLICLDCIQETSQELWARIIDLMLNDVILWSCN